MSWRPRQLGDLVVDRRDQASARRGRGTGRCAGGAGHPLDRAHRPLADREARAGRHRRVPKRTPNASTVLDPSLGPSGEAVAPADLDHQRHVQCQGLRRARQLEGSTVEIGRRLVDLCASRRIAVDDRGSRTDGSPRCRRGSELCTRSTRHRYAHRHGDDRSSVATKLGEGRCGPCSRTARPPGRALPASSRPRIDSNRAAVWVP